MLGGRVRRSDLLEDLHPPTVATAPADALLAKRTASVGPSFGETPMTQTDRPTIPLQRRPWRLALLAAVVAVSCTHQPSVPKVELVLDESSLWEGFSEILMAPKHEYTNTPIQPLSKVVIRKGSRLEPIVIQCVGECEKKPCGGAFFSGCAPSATCTRQVFRVGKEMLSDEQAYTWLSLPSSLGQFKHAL